MTEIEIAKPLHERVGDKIKQQIGDLMTDADLKQLVDAAMKEAFFKKKEKPKRYYNDATEYEPAPIVQSVAKLMSDRIDVALKAWLDDHPQEMTKAINDAVSGGILAVVKNWFDSAVSTHLDDFQQGITETLRKNR